MITMFEIFKSFTFDSAHKLIKVAEGHPCSREHGHTYSLTVYLKGELNNQDMVMDYRELTKVVKPLIEKFDHNCLNDIEGLESSTSENIAMYVWRYLKPQLPLLSKIVIQETQSSGVIYCGENLI